MKHRAHLVALLAAATLVLAGCGDDADDKTADRAAADHNDADVTFAQDMIPHHQQAIEMARLAEDRAASPEVRRLATAIEGAQDPEIETMTGWLESWGEDVPDSRMGMDDMDGDEMDGMGDDESDDSMPGMMSDEDMADLGDAHQAAFDRMFLTMMITHHEGAIEMARTERAEGEYDDAVALAAQIETAQRQEIETMRDLLSS